MDGRQSDSRYSTTTTTTDCHERFTHTQYYNWRYSLSYQQAKTAAAAAASRIGWPFSGPTPASARCQEEPKSENREKLPMLVWFRSDRDFVATTSGRCVSCPWAEPHRRPAPIGAPDKRADRTACGFRRGCRW